MQVQRAVARALPLGLLVAALGWLAWRTHQVGHDWGDDFALYIRQAQSLTGRGPGPTEVVADNQLSLATSSWSTFSPPAYPWGWPALLAPVVAVFGIDYDVLKDWVIVFWCAALTMWFLLVRERTREQRWPLVVPVLLLVALGVSWPVVTWTNNVVSDIPYLACAFAGLAWLDRCRHHEAWAERFTRRGSADLLVLGVLGALAYEIRREGFAVMVAVLAVSVVEAHRARRREASDGTPLDGLGRTIALPFLTFAAMVLVVRVSLPGSGTPSYPGTGLHNVGHNLAWYRDVAAQGLGLKSPIDQQMTALGSRTLALVVLAVVVGLAVLGAVVRCVEAPAQDLPLAAFAGVHLAALLTAPFTEGRYLFPVLPVVLYFAVQALPTAVRLARRWPPTSRPRPAELTVGAPVLALVALLTVSSARDTWWWAQAATDLRESGAVMDGPAAPDAREMFAAVESLTDDDDVIAFFRCRAMTLETDRPSAQITDLDTLVRRADYYVMERGSTYSQVLVSDDEALSRGLRRVWENEVWVMFEVTPTAKQLQEQRDQGAAQPAG